MHFHGNFSLVDPGLFGKDRAQTIGIRGETQLPKPSRLRKGNLEGTGFSNQSVQTRTRIGGETESEKTLL